jgi:hypothetical protein
MTREHRLLVRLTADEHRQLVATAAQEGIALSEWVRRRLLGADVADASQLRGDVHRVERMLREAAEMLLRIIAGER